MKGYSFTELAKLVEAAMPRAGGAFSGNVSAPRFIGPLQGNADTATAAGRADKLSTARNITIGSTTKAFDGTGNLSWSLAEIGAINASATVAAANKWATPRALQIGNSSKAVDGTSNVSWSLAEIGAVSKAGDTMTGNLTAPAVLVSSAQNTSANALTRKDYVDTAISDRLSASAITADSSLPTNGKYPSHLRFMKPAVVTLDETWPDGSRISMIVDHSVDMAAGDCIVQLTSGTISTSVGADRQIRLRQASREFIFEKIAGQWRAA